MSRRGVVDKSLALYPGVLSSIPGSPSLSNETLSCGPVLGDALKPEPLPVELLGAPGYKTHKTHKPTGPVLVTAKEQPHTIVFYWL